MATVTKMDKERVIRALSTTATFYTEITSEVEMLDVLNAGLPIETLKVIEERGIIDDAELKTFIAPRTLARRKEKLTAEESDLLARLARIHDFAIEVFGNHEKARKWLRTPNRAIKDHVPLQLLRSDYGARIVESLLGRIAHGIFS
ncbi:MAG: hypothetical protein QG625_2427 [Cyanobacteriota bacterium erpe_2018_sw_39hr_WHONDRS-SW48-000098_B_bin.30]|jgi:putative toxin-antitoxin system antitoxin component (TIGR02293 family)|nr:hypothetical protein [Cyanobacteriota bacterium erpe_2018_sw_39hr_WHONDRS-SW48-000098_B_bin.30]